MKKRILSMFLALVMALSLSVPVFAADVFEPEAPMAPVEEEVPAAPAEEEPDEPASVAVEGPEPAAVDGPAAVATDSGNCGIVRWELDEAEVC